MSKWYVTYKEDDLLHFNKIHDPKTGRSAKGLAVTGSTPAKEKQDKLSRKGQAILNAFNTKNVSPLMKQSEIYKLLQGMSQQEINHLKKYLQMHNIETQQKGLDLEYMLNNINESGPYGRTYYEVTGGAIADEWIPTDKLTENTLYTNRNVRINSATDYKDYKKREAEYAAKKKTVNEFNSNRYEKYHAHQLKEKERKRKEREEYIAKKNKQKEKEAKKIVNATNHLLTKKNTVNKKRPTVSGAKKVITWDNVKKQTW